MNFTIFIPLFAVAAFFVAMTWVVFAAPTFRDLADAQLEEIELDIRDGVRDGRFVVDAHTTASFRLARGLRRHLGEFSFSGYVESRIGLRRNPEIAKIVTHEVSKIESAPEHLGAINARIGEVCLRVLMVNSPWLILLVPVFVLMWLFREKDLTTYRREALEVTEARVRMSSFAGHAAIAC